MSVLPLFPLGTVLFPGMALPLHVFEQRYRCMMQDLLGRPEPREFGVVAIREGHEVGGDSIRSLHEVGCVATVRQVHPHPDGRYELLAVGTRRFRLGELDRSGPYLQATVEDLEEPTGRLVDATVEATREAFARYRETSGSGGPIPDDPTALSYAIAIALPRPEQQALLEAPDTARRLQAEAVVLSRELGLMRTLRAMPLHGPTLPPGSQN